MQILSNSYRYIYYGPSCKKLGTLSMILNGFESIFFWALYRNMKNMQMFFIRSDDLDRS